jgi:IPT/TIG domain
MMRRVTIALLLLAAVPLLAQIPGCIVIDSVTPSAGPAGTTVTITGSGFFSCCPFECPAASVTFDGAPAQVVSFTSTRLVVIAPPHGPGPASVTVSQISATATAPAAFVYPDEVPALDSPMLAFVALALIALALVRLR